MRRCLAEVAACSAGRDAAVRHPGPCDENPGETIEQRNGDATAEFDAALCRQTCDALFNEVCGTDNVTYENECVLEGARCFLKRDMTTLHLGACKGRCDGFCPIGVEYEPVCGGDGRTYINKCYLHEKNCREKTDVQVAHDGPCLVYDDDDDGNGCLDDFDCSNEKTDLICGTDWWTYSNMCEVTAKACELGSGDIEVSFYGDCSQRCPSVCPGNIRRVCGTDGVTYENRCLLRSRACIDVDLDLRVEHDGWCIEPAVGTRGEGHHHHHGHDHHHGADVDSNIDCPRLCPLIFRPVCGSDGHTYDNECNLHSKACWNNLTIAVDKMGPCPLLESIVVEEDGDVLDVSDDGSEDPCQFECEGLLFPVCGSDGRTYGSECELTTMACRSESRIRVAYIGPCGNDDGGEDDQPCSNFCPRERDPVCASDGITYDNECKLRFSACKSGDQDLHAIHDGACTQPDEDEEESCPLFCPALRAPVCGSDGNSYANECKLKFSSCQTPTPITVLFLGACDDEPECPPGHCNYILKPVCGTDGVTYGNECELWSRVCNGEGHAEEDALRIKHYGGCRAASSREGRCPQSNKCPQAYRPVCGSDGRTYSNVCLLRAAADCVVDGSLTLKHEGACAEDDKLAVAAIEADECDDIKCTFQYRPVCGTDDVTYSNACHMEKLNCGKARQPVVKHEGECGALAIAPIHSEDDDLSSTKCGHIVCPSQRRPACGSDGVTYNNLCELNRAKCVTGGALENVPCFEAVVSETESSSNDVDACPETCTLIYRPVCGDDGLTYPNECTMKKENCMQRDRTAAQVRVVKEGPCTDTEPHQQLEVEAVVAECDEICTQEYVPVCGTDGITYHNRCMLEKASCLNGGNVRLLMRGECLQVSAVESGGDGDGGDGGGECIKGCTQEFRPVCGSDGHTYSNACNLRKLACERGKAVRVVASGACGRDIGQAGKCSQVIKFAYSG